MTLGQFLLLMTIVVLFWMGSRLKKHETRIKELEEQIETEE
jgi:hypothetical protein